MNPAKTKSIASVASEITSQFPPGRLSPDKLAQSVRPNLVATGGWRVTRQATLNRAPPTTPGHAAQQQPFAKKHDARVASPMSWDSGEEQPDSAATALIAANRKSAPRTRNRRLLKQRHGPNVKHAVTIGKQAIFGFFASSGRLPMPAVAVHNVGDDDAPARQVLESGDEFMVFWIGVPWFSAHGDPEAGVCRSFRRAIWLIACLLAVTAAVARPGRAAGPGPTAGSGNPVEPKSPVQASSPAQGK